MNSTARCPESGVHQTGAPRPRPSPGPSQPPDDTGAKTRGVSLFINLPKGVPL